MIPNISSVPRKSKQVKRVVPIPQFAACSGCGRPIHLTDQDQRAFEIATIDPAIGRVFIGCLSCSARSEVRP